ncbi:hypothetical protein MJG53_020346 [Ovis ammon polii x Ovis aries]|uniref:Uncharacterized protein n=1 Tax=Ovis ammon polii x Ovis aries TaxID=2918886 RepID=A0ACB9VNQ0_9CETA|nr:hypothetical protein MJG53_020346 [Ovis ammon polii x Ovis aries]
MTFSTFQPLDLTRRGCQGPGLLLGPRLQAPEEAWPSPRGPAGQATPLQAPGAACSPKDVGKEEDQREEALFLQAETRAWFQKTQAHELLQHGAAPIWFHGFITRREAERLLETKPQGCYLVRFSESAVTFVLTYRSRTCCRHFLLAQLGDGRHVVLGEDSAHARLQDLLRHYTACPLSPYGETLTEPLARQPSQWPRPKPPIPAKPQLQPEVYTSPAPRPRPALPPKPSNPIYNEPDEPIDFYAMGRGSPGEAPSNIYEGRGYDLGPCFSPQNPGGQQLHSENSVAEQGHTVPHRPLPRWGHTLPYNLSRQVLQDRGQAWLPLGPPQ